jgi:hypothetical protein
MLFDQLKRRDFITLLGGAAVAWPLAARARSRAKSGALGSWVRRPASAQSQWTAAAIEYRWAEGRFDHLTQIIGESVRLNVELGQERQHIAKRLGDFWVRLIAPAAILLRG